MQEVLSKGLIEMLKDTFFPNRFSYGVLANIRSRAVPGRGFGAEGSGRGFREGLGQVQGKVPRRFR